MLLDDTLWHAYEVTPEGCLRQFNPNEPPRAEPEPLSKACIDEGHDIVSSFFNIDTTKHKTAKVAFASDPWPRTVLDAYRTGKADIARFVQLNLEVARSSPGTVGMAMKADALQVDQLVFEYAQASQGDFDSVHGFHSRHGKLEGFRGYVRSATVQHGLTGGVLALVLDDPIGRVQELNATRLKWGEARAKWATQPDRAYRKLTSDYLLQLRDAVRKYAEGRAQADANAEVQSTRRRNENPVVIARVGTTPVDEAATSFSEAHSSNTWVRWVMRSPASMTALPATLCS